MKKDVTTSRAVCPPGVDHERLQYDRNRAERLFRVAWEKHHLGPACSTSSRGDLLAHLLDDNHERSHMASPRAAPACCRVTAATIIQWLGTNVGQGFLREVQNQIDIDDRRVR